MDYNALLEQTIESAEQTLLEFKTAVIQLSKRNHIKPSRHQKRKEFNFIEDKFKDASMLPKDFMVNLE
jgi:hypothetical protein